MSREYYDSQTGNIGLAIIFNQIFLNEPKNERTGTIEDKDRLEKTLLFYGFKIRCYDDRSDLEIQDILENVSQEDHDENNCLLIVFMSHGSETQLKTTRRNLDVEELFYPFYKEKCPNLVDKPKFIFIQACRGSEVDKGFGSSSGTLYNIFPKEKDFLVFYATYGGYAAVREIPGSWFIQAICEVLENSKDGIELNDFLTKVSQLVASYELEVISNGEKTYIKQIPVRHHTLTKRYYLKPERR